MSSPPSSIELWTVAKVIGRECSSVNKAFYTCKKSHGEDPNACEAQSALSSLCAIKVVNESKDKFPQEFKKFAECLDYNDFRYNDCRESEKAFLSCWNNKNGSA